MMIAGIFEWPAAVLAWLYDLTGNYALAIGLIAVIVMALVTPLILKSTKGMLEMQRLAPEMRRLQQEHKGDRQKLNEEMMKLYQEHKVNPMASCLPLVAQMPVFIIMFRILHGMTYEPAGGNELVARAVMNAGGAPADQAIGFMPRYLSTGSELYQSLVRSTEMSAFGLDLSVSPSDMLGQDFARGLVYAGLVAVLGGLYFFQQRMVAARAAVSPTMSETQQKLMQYLPVVFAVFQIFFLLGLVVYYIVQSVLRILQQFYITKRFYAGDESLGRQAQAASERARELAKTDGGGGPLAQARRDLADAKKGAKSDSKNGDSKNSDSKNSGGKNGGGKQQPAAKKKGKGAETPEPAVRPSKRTTPPKNRPTPSAKSGGRPAGRPGGRPASSNRRKRK
ncbi:MAG: YidC/Oxa1 family membrane protein insertase [Ilumatobacteraceae bacterium]|nr:YidC/Oxa1 family membrane protein insertase [Ilumatobacteraceae bacterium]